MKMCKNIYTMMSLSNEFQDAIFAALMRNVFRTVEQSLYSLQCDAVALPSDAAMQ